MPITPFHFGPGALIKAVAPSAFSWSMFALANILIDLEPITLFFLTGDPAHPWLHTLPGAFAVAVITVLLGRHLCEWMLRTWNRRLNTGWQGRYLAVESHIALMPAWLGALIGTFSHLLLDSFMHLDVEALWPFVRGNFIQGWVPLDALHELCVASALVAGAIAILFRAVRSTE